MRGPAAEQEAVYGSMEFSKAVLNILEDMGGEKNRLEDMQRAVLNILEDSDAEKARLHGAQRAVLNILDDLGTEKERLQEAQKNLVQSEHALRGSLREKEVLLKEIHHRVKNNLQVISSLLNLQARYLADPSAREIFNESQNRVQSIALVHEKLYRSADLSHIDFEEYLKALLENLMLAFNAQSRGITHRLEVGGTKLTVDFAIPCGLIVNELVTNALKHAYTGNRPGRVWVALSADKARPGFLCLSVKDDGVGMQAPIDPKRSRSLGLDLVYTFAEQIEGTVKVEIANGTCFLISFPFTGGA